MIKKIKQIAHMCIEMVAENNTMNICTAILHQQTFLKFKNYCNGRAVVVCGAGPSLQKYKPIGGAIHIAVNRSFLYNSVDFDFIFAQDMDGIRTVQNELIEYRKGECIKLLGTQMGNEKEIPESLALKCNALRFNTDLYIYKNGFKSKFVKEIDMRPIGNMPNVGMSVLQFALFMNPSQLYIVGCDMSGAHFANKNESAEQAVEKKKELENLWKKDREHLLAKWQEFKKFAQVYYPDTKIISINPVGLKGMFEDLFQD